MQLKFVHKVEVIVEVDGDLITWDRYNWVLDKLRGDCPASCCVATPNVYLLPSMLPVFLSLDSSPDSAPRGLIAKTGVYEAWIENLIGDCIWNLGVVDNAEKFAILKEHVRGAQVGITRNFCDGRKRFWHIIEAWPE